MKILTVIPITTNPRISELTYFSLSDISLGAIVQVPIQKREIPALVIQSEDANAMKAILRGGEFTLKRIGVASPTYITTPHFMMMARTMAEYYATTTGQIINTLVPKALLNSGVTIVPKEIHEPSHTDTITETYALQASVHDRIAVYKNTVRESFAKQESLLIVVPTITAAQSLFIALSKGLEERCYVLSSKNTKLQQIKIITEAHANKKPILLIATAKYATLFRADMQTIIIEDETSSSYSTRKRPYISLTHCIRTYAQLAGIKLILGSTVLSMKTHSAIKNGCISPLTPPASRARSTVKMQILDMRQPKEGVITTSEIASKELSEQKKVFKAVSDDLHTQLQDALQSNKKVCILAPSRGLAPLTVCRDCKTPVLCSHCDTPITLRKRKDGVREFLCYKCGETKDTDTTCTYCDSWRLDTLGIGIEGVEAELQKSYPRIPIHTINTQHTKTDKQIKDILTTYMQEEQPALLLGSQKMLNFLESVDISIVISLDAMLSVPSFEIDEKVFSLLLKIKERTKERVTIQTRMPDRNALIHALDGDISAFVDEELALRKALSYPPYTIMIKITKTGSKKQIIEDFQNIMPVLEAYGPRVFKHFSQITPSKFALHALLRINVKNYPDRELTEILKSIQPLFEVRVDFE